MSITISSYFRGRNIPVEFRDLPGHALDRGFFDAPAFAAIEGNGLFRCSLAQLHLAAAPHYQGRFRKSRSLQWISAGLEMLQAINYAPNVHHMSLNSVESSEFQAKSSEVIAVGLGIELTRQLIGADPKSLKVIERAGKRCDFAFIKNGHNYVIETRGRKNESQISLAIDDVFAKKAGHGGPKYGFVSHLPRDGSACSVVVVDPPTRREPMEKPEAISRLLRYYSRVTRLAGFWRLSDVLNLRAGAIATQRDYESYFHRKLDFGNVEKLGWAVSVTAAGRGFSFFVPPNAEHAALFKFEQHSFFGGVEKALFEHLVSQDFEALFSYRAPNAGSVPVEEDSFAQINEDGAALVAVSPDRIQWIVG